MCLYWAHGIDQGKGLHCMRVCIGHTASTKARGRMLCVLLGTRHRPRQGFALALDAGLYWAHGIDQGKVSHAQGAACCVGLQRAACYVGRQGVACHVGLQGVACYVCLQGERAACYVCLHGVACYAGLQHATPCKQSAPQEKTQSAASSCLHMKIGLLDLVTFGLVRKLHEPFVHFGIAQQPGLDDSRNDYLYD
jgi:hypothetical protein